MITQKSVEHIPLTPELAKQFSEMPAFTGERKLKSTHVDNLKDLLAAGRFVGTEWHRVIVMDNPSVILRTDGYHSSTMLAKVAETHPESFPKDQTATITTWGIDSVELDGSALFERFNSPISVRKNDDKMGFYLAEWTDMKEQLSIELCMNVARAIHFHRETLLTRIKEGLQIAAPSMYRTRDHGLYFQEKHNRDFAFWAKNWENCLHGWMISKPGLAAQMLENWITNQEDATLFWGEVVKENNPDPDADTREFSRITKRLAEKAPRATTLEFWKLAAKTWKRYQKRAATPELAPQFIPTPESQANQPSL